MEWILVLHIYGLCLIAFCLILIICLTNYGIKSSITN